jgi:photosystem II stability/assembly factor-like uncharacterized protein
MTTASAPSHVYVGAARASSGMKGGIFRQAVGEDRWTQLTNGLPEVTQVQAIVVHPTNPDVVYLGTRSGPYRSADRGEHWERLDFPGEGTEVWSILVHPSNPRILYAGTSPVGVYRSDDAGDSWRRLPNAVQPERVKMKSFICRVMRLVADPARPEELYAALEVGGVMRSLDGGETWDDCSSDLLKLAELPQLKSKIDSDTDIEGMLDGHAVCVTGAKPGTVFLAVRMGLFESGDRGSTWRSMEIGRFSPLTYGRDILVSPANPRHLYACLSPAARSKDGSLYRSQDLGESWTRFDHGVKADSTMMAVALHRRDPDQVYCVSRSGQVFGTQDGGRTWTEQHLPDGVQDVYAVACG